jgi:hypothetical protein
MAIASFSGVFQELTFALERSGRTRLEYEGPDKDSLSILWLKKLRNERPFLRSRIWHIIFDYQLTCCMMAQMTSMAV